MVHDMIGHRAQEHPFRPTAATSADNDEISVLGLCRSDDRAARVPIPNQELCVGASIPGPAHDLYEMRFPLGSCLVHAVMRSAARQATLLKHVDDQQACLEPR